MGVLPSRPQSILLSVVLMSNVFFCVYDIPWHDPEQSMLPYFRHRTGVMATVNLIPTIIMAGRNNPLIPLLDISYDSFQLMHRWFARIVVAESLAHTIAWMVGQVQLGSSSSPTLKDRR